MKFLALVLALILLRLWGSGERVQYDDWFCRWQSRVAAWQLPQVLAMALSLKLTSPVSKRCIICAIVAPSRS